MHMNVDYSHLEGQAKVDKAIADAKDWLSEPQWKAVNEMIADPAINYRKFCDMVSFFTGMDGYPLQALWQNGGREIPGAKK